MAKGKLGKVFSDDLGKNNPVFAQILGICSTLAVTNVLRNTVIMCAGLVFTTALSNYTVSLMRKYMPTRTRMMIETMIIAVYVIIVDIVLRAYLPDVSRELGPYVGLIITNCIVMGRTEAYALQNPPLLSFVDGIASGIGYSYVLVAIAVVREVLGSGAIWGIKILGSGWTNWAMLSMAPGGFFMLAIFIWIVKGRGAKEEEVKAK